LQNLGSKFSYKTEYKEQFEASKKNDIMLRPFASNDFKNEKVIY